MKLAFDRAIESQNNADNPTRLMIQINSKGCVTERTLVKGSGGHKPSHEWSYMHGHR